MTIIFLFLIPAHHLFQLPRGHLREKCTPQTIKKRRQVAQSDQQTINYHSRSTARKPDGMPWPWGTVYIPSSEEREVLHLRHKMTQIRAIILQSWRTHSSHFFPASRKHQLQMCSRRAIVRVIFRNLESTCIREDMNTRNENHANGYFKQQLGQCHR